MRIELEQQEIVAILTNWGIEKYGTHNVSVEQLRDGKATLSVTLSDGDFGKGATRITMEKFGELAKQMKHTADIAPSAGDLEMPNYDSVTLSAI